MKPEYDISTKDEKEVSYIDFIDTILDTLGFNKSNNGTRLLRRTLFRRASLSARVPSLSCAWH